MNDHYFTAAPGSEHRFAEAEYVYRGEKLRFLTDAGVFSRGEVDFGTDTLLRALPQDMAGRVLDLGCGWGPVGITLGKLYHDLSVLMSDVNQRAVDLAKTNIKKNGLQNVEAVASDGFDMLEGTFDCIITNPPIRAGKQTIYRLFDDAIKHLNPGGSLFIVIRRQQGAESALKHLGECAWVIEKKKGFWVIEAKGE